MVAGNNDSNCCLQITINTNRKGCNLKTMQILKMLNLRLAAVVSITIIKYCIVSDDPHKSSFGKSPNFGIINNFVILYIHRSQS